MRRYAIELAEESISLNCCYLAIELLATPSKVLADATYVVSVNSKGAANCNTHSMAVIRKLASMKYEI